MPQTGPCAQAPPQALLPLAPLLARTLPVASCSESLASTSLLVGGTWGYGNTLFLVVVLLPLTVPARVGRCCDGDRCRLPNSTVPSVSTGIPLSENLSLRPCSFTRSSFYTIIKQKALPSFRGCSALASILSPRFGCRWPFQPRLVPRFLPSLASPGVTRIPRGPLPPAGSGMWEPGPHPHPHPCCIE